MGVVNDTLLVLTVAEIRELDADVFNEFRFAFDSRLRGRGFIRSGAVAPGRERGVDLSPFRVRSR